MTEIKYCSQCGNKVSRKVPEDDNRERDCCESCGHIHYENPKIVVGVLPVYKDKILLCKRSIDPRKGLWTVPSGFMENGESLEEGALREANEEAGITPQLKYLQTIYSLPHIGQVYFLFYGELESETAEARHETEAVAFFDYEDIPWDEIAFSSVSFALKAYGKDQEKGERNTHSGVFKKN